MKFTTIKTHFVYTTIDYYEKATISTVNHDENVITNYVHTL